MKKILSGMIFRSLRSIESWILIGFFLFACAYISYIQIENPNNGISHDVNKRFESFSVSAEDAYKLNGEALPEDVFYKLDAEDNEVGHEIDLLFGIPDTILTLQVALIVIYLPVFLGRMFSDGTVKNLIAGGHSKGKIYLSSLIFSAVLDIAMMIISTCIFAVMCLVLKWHPPVYLPIVIVMLLLSLLMSLTVTSVCIAVLFISKKRTAAFIVGFLFVLILFVFPISAPSAVIMVTQHIDPHSEDIKLLRKIKAEEPYNLEEHFKLSEYNFVYSYHGQEIVFFEDSTLPRPVKNALLAAIYLDPAMILHFDSGFTITPYIMYRDGLIAINTAGNILWITLSSFCGIIVFRRKEIRC
ncbi:MAG: hypothetical protein IKF09_08715 [Clostridiales bacterium]|nr:hypothetical protein [Clostridiales bacterium]